MAPKSQTITLTDDQARRSDQLLDEARGSNPAAGSLTAHGVRRWVFDLGLAAAEAGYTVDTLPGHVEAA